MDSSSKNNCIVDRLKESIASLEHKDIEVALSGGVDSVVLLHALCALRDECPFTLRAVHIHHGLQQVADDWVHFCRQLCAHWQVPLRVERVHVVKDSALGLEGAARQARYAMFESSSAPVIALAHHKDDQIETFFLALLRGGGLRAMSAMPNIRTLGNKYLWRPLLDITRAQLMDYAQQHNLSFVNDPSNADTALTRNRLRHDILPVFRANFSHFDEQISQNINDLQSNLCLLDEYAQWEDGRILSSEGVMNGARWQSLSAMRREAALYRFARLHQLGTPRRVSIEAFSNQWVTNIKGHHVWSMPEGKAHAQYGFLWAEKFPNWREITWKQSAYGLSSKEGYCLRAARANDMLSLHIGRKSVMKILQEARVPRFARLHWPVLEDDVHIVRAIVGIRIDEQQSVAHGYFPYLNEFQQFLGKFWTEKGFR